MRNLIFGFTVFALIACDSGENEAEKVVLTEQQRAENPLIKMQDETVNKAKSAISNATQKQQDALDKVGQ